MHQNCGVDLVSGIVLMFAWELPFNLTFAKPELLLLVNIPQYTICLVFLREFVELAEFIRHKL